MAHNLAVIVLARRESETSPHRLNTCHAGSRRLNGIFETSVRQRGCMVSHGGPSRNWLSFTGPRSRAMEASTLILDGCPPRCHVAGDRCHDCLGQFCPGLIRLDNQSWSAFRSWQVEVREQHQNHVTAAGVHRRHSSWGGPNPPRTGPGGGAGPPLETRRCLCLAGRQTRLVEPT